MPSLLYKTNQDGNNSDELGVLESKFILVWGGR